MMLISSTSSQHSPIALLPRGDIKRIIISVECLVLNVLNDDPQFGAIVLREVVQHLVANPQLAARIAEALCVVVPRSIEVDGAVVALLNDRPGTDTSRERGMELLGRRYHVQAIVRWLELMTTAGECFNNVTILLLYILQLSNKLGC